MSKDTIRLHFGQLSSEELLDIWAANDRNEYANEIFEVISEILTERGVNIPPQNPIKLNREPEDNNVSLSNYLRFKALISPSLIQFIYLIGMIIVTIAGFIIIERNALIGIIVLVLGNLFWRITCESFILFFKIHDLLVSIDKKLSAKGC